MGANDGKILTISDSAIGALGDEVEGKSGENSIGKMIYSMGEMGSAKAGCGAGRAYLIAAEGSHRAFIGLSDDGKIENGDEGSEGSSGRLPLYKKMADEGSS